MKKAIDGRQKITEGQLDRSIKSAFDSGLFTLSEIVFDKEHLHAVVGYSFVCGGTAILWFSKGSNDSWNVTKKMWGLGFLDGSWV